MWCVEYDVRDGADDACESDHAAAWYYDFFPYAGGSLCYLGYTYDYGDRAVCICDGFHRRSISCKVFESVPKRKNQSDDWGSRDFCVPDVITGHSEDGAQEDPTNILLMHAAGANVSGQVASVIAGGLVIKLVTAFL